MPPVGNAAHRTRPYPSEFRRIAAERRRAGWGIGRIAETLGVSEGTVVRWLQDVTPAALPRVPIGGTSVEVPLAGHKTARIDLDGDPPGIVLSGLDGEWTPKELDELADGLQRVIAQARELHRRAARV
jgi:transposase